MSHGPLQSSKSPPPFFFFFTAPLPVANKDFLFNKSFCAYMFIERFYFAVQNYGQWHLTWTCWISLVSSYFNFQLTGYVLAPESEADQKLVWKEVCGLMVEMAVKRLQWQQNKIIKKAGWCQNLIKNIHYNTIPVNVLLLLSQKMMSNTRRTSFGSNSSSARSHIFTKCLNNMIPF